MRITAKYLVDFVNKKFEQFEINDYEVYSIEPTRFNAHLIEGGAASLYIKFRKKDSIKNLTNHGYFLCFYPMKHLQQYINSGEYELYINSKDSYSISNFELDIRKIQK